MKEKAGSRESTDAERSTIGSVDVFVLPDDWQFYQCDMGFGRGKHVCVAGEPFKSTSRPVVTLDVQTEQGTAVLYLDAAEASEIWTALGYAIRNASGKDPKPVEFIAD